MDEALEFGRHGGRGAESPQDALVQNVANGVGCPQLAIGDAREQFSRVQHARVSIIDKRWMGDESMVALVQLAGCVMRHVSLDRAEVHRQHGFVTDLRPEQRVVHYHMQMIDWAGRNEQRSLAEQLCVPHGRQR